MDTFDGMKTFVAAVDAGSFTAAAERLGISKKLVSKYVAQLEDRFRVRLLHRELQRVVSLGLQGMDRRGHWRLLTSPDVVRVVVMA